MDIVSCTTKIENKREGEREGREKKRNKTNHTHTTHALSHFTPSLSLSEKQQQTTTKHQVVASTKYLSQLIAINTELQLNTFTL